VSTELLRELSCWRTPPCFSIFLPLDPSHPSSADATRLTLKSMIRDVRLELQAVAELSHSAVDELLAPPEALLAAQRWSTRRRGYGLFGAPGCSIEVHLDVAVPSIAVVADRFVVTPLVTAIRPDDRFFLLAISQNRVRFLRGDSQRLVDVPVPGLPASRANALWFEHHERQLNVHGGSHHGVDRITGTLHGSPADHDLRKQQLRRFFHIVDHALLQMLHAETAPLFVAGLGFELAMYREANHYPHLAELIDIGSPERLSAGELHDRLWPVACRTLDGPRRELVNKVSASPMVLTSMPAILAASEEGRIGSLLVRPDRLLWGRPDDDGHPDRRPGDTELVTVAIGAALEHGATVFPAAAHEMPGDAPVAALLRH
jgi:hypothetical protein